MLFQKINQIKFSNQDENIKNFEILLKGKIVKYCLEITEKLQNFRIKNV